MARCFSLRICRFSRALLAWGFFLAAASASWGEGASLQAVVAGPDTTRVDLTPYLAFGADATGRMTVADVRVPGLLGFHEIEGVWPNFGFTPDTIWLRFRVISAARNTTEWLVELGTSRLDKLHWYVFRGDALIYTATDGNLKEESPTKLDFRHPVLPLKLGPGESVEVYLRIRSETSISAPLTLWDPSTYGKVASHLEWRGGAYFGYLAAMVAIGLCFAVFNRDRIFLVYSLMNGFLWMLFFCVGGYYAWLGLPGIRFWTHQGLLLCMGGSVVTLLLLLRYLFAVPKNFPRFDRYFRLLLFGLGALSLLAVVAPYRPVMMGELFAAMLICVVVAACSYFLFFRINKIHPLFFVIWLGLWFCAFLLFLQPFAVAPMWTTEEQNMRGIMGYGALFFLLALAARARKIRRDNEKSRERVVKAQEQRVAAEEANRFKSLFLANMSHEIRAPLSSLVGLSQAMCLQSDKYALPPEFVKFLNQIRVGGQYLNMMLTNLLDVSAAEAGRNPLHWRVIKMAEWTESVRSLLDPAAMNHEVRLDWKEEFEPALELETDAVRLTQILLNLIHNAIKFSPRGATVEIVLAREGERLRLSVSDEGPGIREEEKDDIFRSFTQGVSESETGSHGAGLGLAVVRKNVELLGGAVAVENRRCGGACFTVSLPLKK